MIGFQYHDGFHKEITALKRRFAKIHEALEIFQSLCQDQFHPTNAKQIIAPGKIHRVVKNNTYSLWKAELVIPKSGLRPNQYPRIWFAIKDTTIIFLCIATHIDNYDDSKNNRVAKLRADEVI